MPTHSNHFSKHLFLFLLGVVSICLQPLFLEAGDPALSSRHKTQVCLVMMVKNEEQIIQRCLESIKNVVDCVCIFNVGSTDNTIALIEDFLIAHDLGGACLKQEWRNWSLNRTHAIRLAQQMLQEQGFSLPDTYLLILDPDMELQFYSSFDTSTLKSDAYLIAE
jgi:glycosyltransferase involved in cell wall biosynthesis